MMKINIHRTLSQYKQVCSLQGFAVGRVYSVKVEQVKVEEKHPVSLGEVFKSIWSDHFPRTKRLKKGNFEAGIGYDHADATYADKVKQRWLKLLIGEDGFFAKARARYGQYHAIFTLLKKQDSAFDPKMGAVAQLKFSSRIISGNKISVLETPEGMRYFVPVAGMAIEGVDVYVKGRWIRVEGHAPPTNLPGGNMEVIADLLLPIPETAYTENDISIEWQNSEVVITVIGYKDRMIKVKDAPNNRD